MRKELSLHSSQVEDNIMRYLSARPRTPHPNIIGLYAYYRYKNKGNLLMPLLQGNLAGLLNNNEQCLHFETDERYPSEMLGLTKALRHLRHPQGQPWYSDSGIHHDLKPANVLLNDGHFVLSDFGIATMSSPTAGHLQESYGHNSWWAAPETLRSDGWAGTASSKSDVFSLGCIFAELLAHMRDRAQGVKAFRARRRPDRFLEAAPFCIGIPSKVNKAVRLELEEIKKEAGSSRRGRLVDIIFQMLKEDVDERCSAGFVVEGLERILLQPNPESTIVSSNNIQQTLELSTSASATQQRSLDGPKSAMPTSPFVGNEEALDVIGSPSHSQETSPDPRTHSTFRFHPCPEFH